MSNCMEQWRVLLQSSDPKEETANAERLAQCARQQELTYQLSLTDRESGADVPVGELAAGDRPLTVFLSVSGRQEPLTWQPLTRESIYPLLLE